MRCSGGLTSSFTPRTGIARRHRRFEAVPNSDPTIVDPANNTNTELARCFLRLANLPNYAFDRLSRYEATLWRHVGQILFALDALDRRKPQERRRRFRISGRRELPPYERDEC